MVVYGFGMRYNGGDEITNAPPVSRSTFGAMLDTLEVPSMSHYTPNAWTPEEDATLREMVQTHSHAEIGARIGKSDKAVRNRAWRLGLRKKAPDFTDEERETIRRVYETCGSGVLNIGALAARLNRPVTSVGKVAGEMGLTDKRREKVFRLDGVSPGEMKRLPRFDNDDDRRAHLSKIRSENLRINGHPRGALGMKHSDETKMRMAESSRRWNATVTPEQREAMRVKRNQTNMERYGTAAPIMLSSSNPYSRANGGKREDLDNRYFRSTWESNYARYLRWLKEQGQIADWEYEPQTFVFAGVTRGVLSYTPDFKVIEKDGSYCWHEIKGWMDAKSKAKLKRMAKFYPAEKIIVIGEEEYKAITKWRSLIQGWESGRRDV
jgi:hypothetical protein